jgi:hypothetical protein
MPPYQDVAEFIPETASRSCINSDGARIDWNEEWRNGSNNAKAVLEVIDRITAEKRDLGQKANQVRGGDVCIRAICLSSAPLSSTGASQSRCIADSSSTLAWA